MAAQKHTKKLLAEISSIFECLLNQNPTLLILPDHMELC